jgi:hypothetical protein
VFQQHCELYGYERKVGLIVDNCTFHGTEQFHALYAEHNVMPLFLPPHNSSQLQPLDLSVFGLTKWLLIRVNRMEKLNIQTQHFGQVVCAFMSAVNFLREFLG